LMLGPAAASSTVMFTGAAHAFAPLHICDD
jgi:hypothetical protein